MILLEYGSTIKLIEKLTETTLKNKSKILCNTILATSISNIGPIYSLVSRKKEKYKKKQEIKVIKYNFKKMAA